MTRGTVKKWIEERKFGFIKRDDRGGDVFVHASALPDDLDALLPGDEVEFEVASGRDGRTEARNVRLIERRPEAA